jgi:hypothetical protein
LYTYFAILEDTGFDHEKWESYFREHDILLEKHYSNFNIAKLSSKNELKIEELEFVVTLEPDDNDFTV